MAASLTMTTISTKTTSVTASAKTSTTLQHAHTMEETAVILPPLNMTIIVMSVAVNSAFQESLVSAKVCLSLFMFMFYFIYPNQAPVRVVVIQSVMEIGTMQTATLTPVTVASMKPGVAIALMYSPVNVM